MSTIKKIFLFLIMASLATVCNAHALPLTGKTLSGSSTWATLSPSQAVVGAGIEFKTSVDIFDPFFTIDFTEGGLVTFAWAYQTALGHFAPEEILFSDTFGTIRDIIGLNLLSTIGVTNIAQSDLTFGSDFISFNVGSGTLWDVGGYFTAQIDVVPEPATMLLIGTGLVGLAGVRRKFRK